MEDPTGLLWGRARYLEPYGGAWISADEVRWNPSYAYSIGRPAEFVDTDGRDPIVPGTRIGRRRLAGEKACAIFNSIDTKNALVKDFGGLIGINDIGDSYRVLGNIVETNMAGPNDKNAIIWGIAGEIARKPFAALSFSVCTLAIYMITGV